MVNPPESPDLIEGVESLIAVQVEEITPEILNKLVDGVRTLNMM